jgi:hypothetical protein
MSHSSIIHSFNYLSEGALHLYATHHQKNAYNEEMVRRTATEDNPPIVINCKDKNHQTKTSQCRHLNDTYEMRKTMLYRAAMVELSNMNLVPKWGLDNGALGTVIDIIF